MRKFITVLISCSLLFIGCNKTSAGDLIGNSTDNTKKEITILPEREVKVYFGVPGKWHSWTNKYDWEKWDYVRNNLTGFYTNFIDMWMMSFQNNQETAAETCKKLYEAFGNKSCFFETSMETQVNSSTNGFNNEISDRRSIDLLTDAGFSIDYASVNYLDVNKKEDCLSRINLIRTYKGDRKCLSLYGPWGFNGNISSDAFEDNIRARECTSWCDGIETDGPLGFWVSDQGKMKSGSYSIVKYAQSISKESTVMLSPYSAGVPTYDMDRDFLRVSKQCVMDHEDNNAAPDIWAMWLYGGEEPMTLNAFPEYELDDNGDIRTVNTTTGVAYWLLKHLKEFPVLKAGAQGISQENNHITLDLKNGNEINIPIEISNSNLSAVELSPVIRAIIDKNDTDWDISFFIKGKDVTDNFIYEGGMNFIQEYRLTQDNKIIVDMNVAYKGDEKDGNTIRFEVMSNISNTKNKKELLVIDVKAQ